MDVKRASMTITDDSGKIQLAKVEIYSTDVCADVEHHQTYGLAGNVGSGTGLVIDVNGTHFVLGLNNLDKRPTGLAKGEVQVWSEHSQKIYLKADGTIDFIADKHTFKGDVDIKGILTNDNVNLTNHIHTGDDGGNTGQAK